MSDPQQISAARRPRIGRGGFAPVALVRAEAAKPPASVDATGHLDLGA